MLNASPTKPIQIQNRKSSSTKADNRCTHLNEKDKERQTWRIRLIRGTKNAAVFPDPVCAHDITSRLVFRDGMEYLKSHGNLTPMYMGWARVCARISSSNQDDIRSGILITVICFFNSKVSSYSLLHRSRSRISRHQNVLLHPRVQLQVLELKIYPL